MKMSEQSKWTFPMQGTKKTVQKSERKEEKMADKSLEVTASCRRLGADNILKMHRPTDRRIT
jgi:hypothetical protein